MNKKNKKFYKKGIALLFSIMLSAVFLSISLGVLSITTKELRFNLSSRDTNNAFYATESGIECALYNDKSTSTFFVDTASSTGVLDIPLGEITIGKEKNETNSFTCFGKPVELMGVFPDFSFVITGLGSDSNSCAKVEIVKKHYTSVDLEDLIFTRIISKGYNVGDGNCESSNTNRVERVLEVSY